MQSQVINVPVQRSTSPEMAPQPRPDSTRPPGAAHVNVDPLRENVHTQSADCQHQRGSKAQRQRIGARSRRQESIWRFQTSPPNQVLPIPAATATSPTRSIRYRVC